MLSQQEINSIAAALAKALAPLLRRMGNGEANGGDGEVGTTLPDGTRLRSALSGCTNFADADRRLAQGGIKSAGRRRMLIAKVSPQLFNALMSEPYTG